MIKYALILGLALTLQFSYSFGQSELQVSLPAFNDEYCNSVKKLESGLTDIDYQAFRFSFIESEQFLVAGKRRKEFDSLKTEMYEQMKSRNYKEIVNTTKQMLSIDYTSLLAHKILRQTYEIIGDTLNAAKYKSIQFGLLKSIVNKGDGLTCANAWPVIQIDEEYFILQVLGVKLIKQGIDNKNGLCDKMEVQTEDGKAKIYYFETSKVFEGYHKKGL